MIKHECAIHVDAQLLTVLIYLYSKHDDCSLISVYVNNAYLLILDQSQIRALLPS